LLYMDYVTRQFINLTKHFRKDLRSSLKQINKTIEKNSNAVTAADKRRQQEKHIQPLWAEGLVSKYEQTVASKTADSNRQHRTQVSIKRAMWCTFWATLAAFVAAAIYAGIAASQLKQAKIAAFATQQAATAATTAANVANETLLSSEKHFRIEQRPYVTLEDMRFDPPLEQNHNPAIVKFNFRNAGKTPALKATFKLDILIDGKETTKFPQEFRSELTIPSERSVGSSVSVWIGGPGDYEGISGGTRKLSIKGMITYTDIFKEGPQLLSARSMTPKLIKRGSTAPATMWSRSPVTAIRRERGRQVCLKSPPLAHKPPKDYPFLGKAAQRSL
jgi:hypothetical protein